MVFCLLEFGVPVILGFFFCLLSIKYVWKIQLLMPGEIMMAASVCLGPVEHLQTKSMYKAREGICA